MLKALIKKQFGAMWYGLINRNNKGNKKSSLLYGVLFIYVFGYLGVMNYNLFKPLCEPLIMMEKEWLYFAFAAVYATIFAIIGGVFTVQAQVYEGRDNETLLSMPIPPIKILISRLIPVYAQVFLFSSVFMAASYIPYAQVAAINAKILIAWILLLFALPCLGLVLCCILGWCTAWISSKMRNKNIFTIVVSFGFLLVYFMFAFKIQDYMLKLITPNTSDAISESIKSYLWVFYQVGMAATGDLTSLVIFVLIIIAALAVTFLALSHGYLNIMTRKTAKKKAVYRSKKLKVGSAFSALMRKEAKLFFGCPVYLLNCGLGVIFLAAIAIYLFISGDGIINMLGIIFPGEYTAPFCGIIAICAVSSMNIVSAPSISMEGESLWILQSLPATSWKVLKSKLAFHCLITAPFAVICGAVLAFKVAQNLLVCFMLIATPLVFVLFVGCVGLILNLKKPNLHWETPTVAVKQGMAVIFTMLISWAILSVFIILFATGVFDIIPAVLSCCLPFCIFVLGDLFMLMWLKDKGTKIFETL